MSKYLLFCWIVVAAFTSVEAWLFPAPCARPPNFPSHINLIQQDFQNPDKTIEVADLWTAIPLNGSDVVILANWASANGYFLRPRGKTMNWSPLSVTPATDCRRTLMVDTTQYLKKTTIFPNGTQEYPFPHVWAESGVTLDDLLEELEQKGLGMAIATALGGVTLGGVLATDGHGFGIRVDDPDVPALHSYGTVSNLVLSLDVVAWDETSQRYALKKVSRTSPESSALITHIGRAFVVSATLRVDINYNLRCIVRTDIAVRELFADPNSANGSVVTIGSLVEVTGRLNILWFPFTEYAWLRICSYAAIKPADSKVVTEPYTMTFTSNIPPAVAPIISDVLALSGPLTPLACQAQFAVLAAAVVLTDNEDLWGWSKNHLLFVGKDTLLVSVMGYAILTTRTNIQLVISMVISKFNALLEDYKSRNLYPINEVMEIRISGVDDPNDLELSGAKAGFINVVTPVESHPEFNAAIWFDIVTVPNAPSNFAFLADMESFYLNTFNGPVGYARPEWSKGWAYTPSGRWTNSTVLQQIIPSRYKDWGSAVCYLKKLDAKGIYGNEFLNALFVSSTMTPC